LPAPGSDPAPQEIADCGGFIRFDPEGTLSPEEYFRLFDDNPQTKSSGEGRLSYRAFGGDSLVREGDKLELRVEVGEVKLADGMGMCAQPFLVTLHDRGVLTAGGRAAGRPGECSSPALARSAGRTFRHR
jgi:hypothetical protein